MDIKQYCDDKGLDYNSLNKEFNISNIEHSFGKGIAEKIVEKFEKYRSILEEYMHADGSNVAVLMEINELDEKDKDRMNEIYKKVIVLEREFLILDLENELFIDFVKKSMKEWNELKPELKKLLFKAKESWKKDTNVTEKLGYLG